MDRAKSFSAMQTPITVPAVKASFEAAGLVFIDADETAGEGVHLGITGDF